MRLRLDGFWNTFVVIAIATLIVNVIIQFLIDGGVRLTSAIILAIILGLIVAGANKYVFNRKRKVTS